MKFESITDMLIHFGSVKAMNNYIDAMIAKAQKSMSDHEHLEHVFLQRDLLIGGFQLREIDAFLEGLYCEVPK